ncbi:S-layer protein, partial [Campylobacter fetus]|nr:S-layer protein [Campylobacter fetus]
DASAITLGANATIKGGSGADSITVKGGLANLTLGEGSDTVTLKKGGTSTDYITINDFSKDDKIVLDSIDFASAKAIEKLTLANTTGFSDYVNQAASGDGNTNPIVKYFHYQNDTYIVVDKGAETTLVNTDTVIKLAGIHELTGTQNITIADSQ